MCVHVCPTRTWPSSPRSSRTACVLQPILLNRSQMLFFSRATVSEAASYLRAHAHRVAQTTLEAAQVHGRCMIMQGMLAVSKWQAYGSIRHTGCKCMGIVWSFGACWPQVHGMCTVL